MRIYKGFLVDNSRWERFPDRPDDVIISTPPKCGTTWIQNIVGMLLLDRIEFGQPLTSVSPWLDIQTTSDQQVFELLEAQKHRRFVKTHIPLDGLPWREAWTYITVFRHPLDAALSYRDHGENTDRNHVEELLTNATGVSPDLPPRTAPTDPASFLRDWIESDQEPNCSGLLGLSDFANSLRVAWELRHEPNVHFFHYDALWQDLSGQVTRLASILDVSLDDRRHRAIVEGATLDSMRSRARDTAPFGDTGQFLDPTAFFRHGGRRDWPALLTPDEISGVAQRLEMLVGHEAAAWVLTGGG